MDMPRQHVMGGVRGWQMLQGEISQQVRLIHSGNIQVCRWITRRVIMIAAYQNTRYGSMLLAP